MQIKTVGF